MNFPLYIAKRYLRSVSKNNAINIINRIASLGIIVGATSLFVVLSVFSGLINFSVSFSNTIDPDLKALPVSGKSFFITPTQEQKIRNTPGVAAFSKVIEERVLFVFNSKEEVTYLKGVDSLFTNVSTIKESVYQGQWLENNTIQVVVGRGIADKLSIGLLDVNNVLEVYVPRPGKGAVETPDNAFNKSVLLPAGVYAISEDLDSKYVFADFSVAQRLLEFKPGQVSAFEVKLKPGADEEQVTSALQSVFNNKITIKNRAQLNDALYKMLRTENLAIYLIFTLVIILILFAFAGAIIMMILDKKANLKTLYNLGAEPRDLRRIFLLQGTLLCIKGGGIGLAIGSVIVLLQQHFQLVMITESLAYPVVFSVMNILIVLGTIVVLGFIASLIASSRISKKLLEE
ncbi:ABC transporter permease [Flavobacterium sp. 3HN19-14]|uniref:ABC transporter permease n=1 Tax=Flavobacterium sp. 3HN19-14 TaxID=3448133 RepID=UPI003EDEE215